MRLRKPSWAKRDEARMNRFRNDFYMMRKETLAQQSVESG